MGRSAYSVIPPKGEIRFGVCAEHSDTDGNERNEMSAAELDLHVETESERIERWRAEELERAGYESSAASLLAGRPDVDLHYAIDLLRNGCAPELALQILL